MPSYRTSLTYSPETGSWEASVYEVNSNHELRLIGRSIESGTGFETGGDAMVKAAQQAIQDENRRAVEAAYDRKNFTSLEDLKDGLEVTWSEIGVK